MSKKKDEDLKKKFNIPERFQHMPLNQVVAELEAELARDRQSLELPFLYGWNWYQWAYDFYTSTNKINLLCAANQISKSSTQIRKCINWATDTKLWPELWRVAPVQFWYLYPTQKQVNAEFETKWKLFLPKGEMKDDPYYGWKEEKYKGDIIAIHFKSGVHVYFKTYMQSASALQTGTCDAIFCDEELPVERFDELMLRISASDGYFHMVFTATLGQDYWRRCMEPEADEVEALPQAFKQTVSLYQAMSYMDGQPSHWTLERIKVVEARCSTHQEVLKRVFGKFIVIGGRKYESFDMKRHKKPKHHIPSNWLIYEAVDTGGGGDSHKAAICFVAVKPDFRQGRVFLGKRMDTGDTTAGDVFVEHQRMVKANKLTVVQKGFDWGDKDFGVIAQIAGDPFEPAEKSHAIGVPILNTLFKNDMLLIYEDEELIKLCAELSTVKAEGSKTKAKDDFCDALRYCVAKIPWDWTVITGQAGEPDEQLETPLSAMEQEVRDRRDRFESENDKEEKRIDEEFSEWNEQYEGY